MRPFKSRLSAVHHKFRFFSGEYDETVAPFRVPQHAAAEEDFVVIEGVGLLLPVEDPLEVIQLVVRGLAYDFPW